MPRPKKNKPLQIKETLEVDMSKASDETLEKIKQHKEETPIREEETVVEELNTEIDVSRLELEKVKKEIEEKQAVLKKISSREHDAHELEISEKMVSRGNENKALKEKIAKQKAYDDQKITGKFMNRRAPGQPAKLAYIKYETDPVKWWEFYDGVTYTIPRGFADQINEYYYSPRFIQNQAPMDPDNPESGIASVDNSNKKYAFVPTNF